MQYAQCTRFASIIFLLMLCQGVSGLLLRIRVQNNNVDKVTLNVSLSLYISIRDHSFVQCRILSQTAEFAHFRQISKFL